MTNNYYRRANVELGKTFEIGYGSFTEDNVKIHDALIMYLSISHQKGEF